MQNDTSKIFCYIIQNWNVLVACLCVGMLIGFLLHQMVTKGVKSAIRNLDNVVLGLSFFGAIFCLVSNVFYGEERVSVQILGFYTSFIFSWLLTKKSAKVEYQRTQHKVAKNTYRHIQDVETAVLVTQDRLQELKDSGKTEEVDIDGILDNIDIILAGIRSNEEDWKEMLKHSYVEKLKEQEDPETKLFHSREIRQNRLKSKNSPIEQPDMEEIKQLEDIAKSKKSGT